MFASSWSQVWQSAFFHAGAQGHIEALGDVVIVVGLAALDGGDHAGGIAYLDLDYYETMTALNALPRLYTAQS